MTDENDEADEAEERVGYKRPPKRHQFRKNTSGNPNGRPRRKTHFDAGPAMDQALAATILSEGARPVAIRENGKSQSIDTKTALLRRLNHSGLTGDLRSQIEALKLLLAAERFSQEQKVAATPQLCPDCAALGKMTDAEIVAELMELQSSGRLKLPAGVELEEASDRLDKAEKAARAPHAAASSQLDDDDFSDIA